MRRMASSLVLTATLAAGAAVFVPTAAEASTVGGGGGGGTRLMESIGYGSTEAAAVASADYGLRYDGCTPFSGPAATGYASGMWWAEVYGECP